MSVKQARALLNKYKEGNCSEEEKAIVERWLFQYNNGDINLSEESIEAAQIEIWAKLPVHERKVVRLITFPRIAAAASIILCLSFGGYYLLHKQPSQQIVKSQQPNISPGGNKAVLTLANGNKISLTDAQNGNIAQQSGTQIKKAQNGQVVYIANNAASGHSSNNGKAINVAYNTISTPRGGQWQLTLPDGSRVWLNAASSITFPTAFIGNKRNVKITGEAYFEVVHNAAKPFTVSIKGQTIEDLGTHFNIDAYDDEPVINTTLLEGSVRIRTGSSNVVLKPGQQAQVTQYGASPNIVVASNIDIEEAVAWKNGYFQFNESSLVSIMRQLSRWYDIDVVFEGKYPTDLFLFKVPRDRSLKEILKIFENDGINFKIEGRKLIVRS